MSYIYPKTIQTTTGHSIAYATQKITNPSNLCSGSTSLAYWGVKNPTYVGDYMRNYPDSITTISGSYYRPETIYATNWDTGNISNDAIIKKVTIEYKWEQVSYSCGTWDCYGRFEKPTITLISGTKNLISFKGAKPEAIRYNNNKTNPSRMNTNSAELATLHSHTIDLSEHNLTIKDLQKMKLKFAPAKNTHSEYCRIIMQFIRIKITYEAPVISFNPSYRITEAKITPTEAQLKNGIAEYTYKCTIKTILPYVKATNCSIVPNSEDVIIDYSTVKCTPADTTNKFDRSKNIWHIGKLKNYQTSITFKARSKTIGIKKITATIDNKYADSVDKSVTAKVDVIDPPNNIDWKVEIEGESEPYIFDGKNKNIRKCLKITINRDQDQPNRNETLIIDTDGWITEDVWTTNCVTKQTSPGVWKIENITGNNIVLRTMKDGSCIPISAGEYNISVKHTEKQRGEETKSIKVYVTDTSLPMDYFKLRLEDGSDIRYNSLTFIQGDDLDKPLTYQIDEDNFTDHLSVKGESKHIPTHEARYVTYTIKSDINIENALCKIDIKNIETGDDCSEIIIASDNQIKTIDDNNDKFYIIDKLIKNEEKKIKFIVQSETPQTCIFKLKVLNYDEYDSRKWTPSYIYFKDMPSVKLSIESDKDELTINEEDIEKPNSYVNIYYYFENKSNTNGQNLKFQIKEPPSFKTIDYNLYEYGYTNVPIQAFFNTNSKIVSFTEMKGEVYNELKEDYESHKYVLHVKYQATQKGIYDFIVNTYDNDKVYDDDQWINSASKKIMVDITSNTLIKTSTSKQRPYINELIDFKIKLKNYLKKQKKFSFTIKDIGAYNQQHNRNNYDIEYYICEKGSFSNDNDKIGIWTLENIDINEECELVLTLRPKDLGYHVIETTFTDSEGQIQHFENVVNVIERNKQIDFRVYHAVSAEENIDCSNCDKLTEICNDDFINLGDELYYVCDITNNSKNDIDTLTHIYARLPDSFLDNDILCSSHDIDSDINNNLLHIQIPYIKACSNIKTCFKIMPSENGSFVSNFMLTNKNSKVYHQNLKINVDKEFNQRQLEHEITIFDFDKTNKYFRYEIDDNNDIFKFFNQGNDKSLRLVDIENYKTGGIESYKGSNLQKIVRDIANNSKYVEPELLRIGNNHLATKGYEIYPDGFIRRFGLLNSEVFHYTGQLPIISNLADKAMRWDEDEWDTKLWGGDIYDNGVFDLTIDYAKIPTNFNILELDNPIQNLQALVDQVKPYGTQAVCYYSAKLYLDLAIDIELDNFEINHTTNLPLKISDIGLCSLYNRHDNSLVAYYDLFNIDLKTDVDLEVTMEANNKRDNKGELHAEPFDQLGLKTNVDLIAEQYDQQYSKKYIHECFDIVQNIYSHHPDTKNITITKDFKYNGEKGSNNSFNANINDLYSFEYIDPSKITILINNVPYYISYEENNFDQFIGFKISNEQEKLFDTNFYTKIHKYNIQIQICDIENNANNVIHIFCSINDQKYIHIGYIIANLLDEIIIKPNNYSSYSYTQQKDNIKFSVQDTAQTIKEQPNKIVQFNNKNKWDSLFNIDKSNNYAFFENNSDVDIECKEEKVQVPTLGVKFDNIKIGDNDEIIDIGFNVKARSNKTNFEKDIDIDLHKNGDNYIPNENIASYIYHPNQITNVNQQYTSSITVQQPNITICSNCMKTALGLHDVCPYCGSNQISHYDEKKKVTICNNPECQWIVDGWNDYCTHCLSEDVENTEVDFNKTYCYNCHNIENDYYNVCPKCFHPHVEHMNNDETKYFINGKDQKNIDSVIIKSDTNRVNIFNIEVPNDIIKRNVANIEKLNLHIHGTNNNDGNFYVCPECNIAFLGDNDECPYCSNKEVIKYTFNNTTMDIYYQAGTYIEKIDKNTTDDQLNGEFDISIDILKLLNKKQQSTFKLLIYAENLQYNDINSTIEKLDIDEESYDLLVNNIPIMNLLIDNIYYDQKYKNEKEWQGLNQLQGLDHTGLKYISDNDEDSNYIKFDNFNIKNDTYNHMYFYINGINKSDKHAKIELIITDKNGNTYSNIVNNISTEEDDDNISYNNIDNIIPPNLFNCKIDLLTLTQTQYIEDLSIQIRFLDIKNNSEIIITSAYIKTEKEQSKNILHKNINNNDYEITNNNDNYHITTDNLFNLKNEQPYYLDGRQLDTNLICYIDFGKLKNQEYIRLYDIEMIVLYKNKYGKLITQHMDILDDKYTKQLIYGDIQKNNTEIWGSTKTSTNILNNLESQIFNNTDENNLQSTPLMLELAQAFSIVTPGIGRLHLNYDGRVGYPSDTITLQIYDNYQNKPDNLLYSTNIVMPKTSDEVIIDIDLDDLPIDQYWFKLIDTSANKNNYHRFNHNTNVEKGNLIISDERISDYVLSFAIDSNVDLKQYNRLPTSLDLDGAKDFKSCLTLYRYNTKSVNNAYIKNLKIETGFLSYSDIDVLEDVEDIITVEGDNDGIEYED